MYEKNHDYIDLLLLNKNDEKSHYIIYKYESLYETNLSIYGGLKQISKEFTIINKLRKISAKYKTKKYP